MEGETALEGIGGRVADLRVTITPEGKECRAFTIRLAADGAHSTTLTYEPRTRRLTLDRSQAGFHQDIVHLRSCTVRGQSDTLSLRILLDRNSVEVFINGGEQTMTACIYTPARSRTHHLCRQRRGPYHRRAILPRTVTNVFPLLHLPSLDHARGKALLWNENRAGLCTLNSPCKEQSYGPKKKHRPHDERCGC